MSDLDDIISYSTLTFGKKVANRYLTDIEGALLLLQEHPGILQQKQDISPWFSFYPVREHHLVCTEFEDIIVVLTITHCHADLPDKLLKLEPTLLQEAKIFWNKLLSSCLLIRISHIPVDPALTLQS
jgi:plasmid stabilization system protein ParE